MEAPRLRLQTEIDVALKGFRNRIFLTVGLIALLVLGVEAVLIFSIVPEHALTKLMSFNGVIVMVGGLAIVAVTGVLILLPTKLIAYESLKLVKETKALADTQTQRMDRTLDRIDAAVMSIDRGDHPLVKRAEALYEKARLDFLEQTRKIESELRQLRTSVMPEGPLPKPGNRGSRQPGIPHVEPAGQAAAGNNGAAS